MKKIFFPEIRPNWKDYKPKVKTIYPDKKYTFNEVFYGNSSNKRI